MNWGDFLQWVAIAVLAFISMGNTRSIRNLGRAVWRRPFSAKQCNEGDPK